MEKQFKINRIKNAVKETELKAYKPKVYKKVKKEEEIKETNYNPVTHTNSIQAILDKCDSDVKILINSNVISYKATNSELILTLNNKTKLKINYANQPKQINPKCDNMFYSLFDKHNKNLLKILGLYTFYSPNTALFYLCGIIPSLFLFFIPCQFIRL